MMSSRKHVERYRVIALAFQSKSFQNVGKEFQREVVGSVELWHLRDGSPIVPGC